MKKTTFLQCDGSIWMKGNLHTHSTYSDGLLSPEELIEGYRARGYDFLALTDHDAYFSHDELDTNGFLLIPSFELSAPIITGVQRDYRECHIGVLQKSTACDFVQGQAFCLENKEQVIDFLEKHHENYMYILNHPYWSLVEWEEVMELPHISCMEVVNYGCELECFVGEASHFWNTMLRKGRKLWAVAADDNHNGGQQETGWPFDSIRCDSFGGWVCVKAKDRSVESIIGALESGSFYSSCGPQIHDFYVEDGRFHVECSPCQRLIIIGDRGDYQQKFGDNIVEFCGSLHGSEEHIRVQCMDAKGRMAYSNPIFLLD